MGSIEGRPAGVGRPGDHHGAASMSEVAWTAEQVLALAPDAGSAKSGKELSNAGKWASLGRAEGVLWGECKGSGAQPYQTKVELTEPAFHCSCPSRKFPCKHALGLFLIFANKAASLAEGTPPAWVASWLEGRASRVEKKAAREQAKQEKIDRGEPAVDPVAKQKREAARRAKVAAGLDELDQWLADLVRQGLTTVGAQPPHFWTDRARRLVDAQAPGAAGRVRRVAELTFSGDRWQGALLDRLARLHLMAEAHRRMDALPDAARADLAAAVGYPADLDEVKAGQGARDTWIVAGQRTEQVEQVKARRTWLVGRESGRPALVLDFAHASQPLPDGALPAGSAIDADLAFFPGAAPLRALMKDRHGPPSPAAEIPGDPGIVPALARYAVALSANPWMDLFPVVVAGVRLVPGEGGWVLRDEAGAGLPLSSRFDQGWSILAATAGRPMTISGEYDGATLLPLGYACEGIPFRSIATDDQEARPAVPPPVAGPAGLAEAWEAATVSAVVGVGRKPFGAPEVDGTIGVALKALDGKAPEAKLLASAALLSQYHRAGRRPAACEADPPPPCPAEDRPDCPTGPARILAQLSDGHRGDLIPEWLGLLGETGFRLPDDALVELLHQGRHRTDLRDLLRPVLGTRGRWLSALNPAEWGYIGGEADRSDPDAIWQTGTNQQRRAALAALRKRDPGRARDLVASTWSTEPADERAAAVKALAQGLSMADEPFLEAALDDRAKTVREAAAELLARLLDSRFSRRMAERARACLSWDGKALAVEPPSECDAAMARDGVEKKPPTGTGERAWWLSQVVAAAPATALEGPPDQVIAASKKGDWADQLWRAWATAAAREGNPDWCAALLDSPPKDYHWADAKQVADLFNALPADRREAVILDRLRASADPFGATDPAMVLLTQTDAPIGAALGREILKRLAEKVGQTATKLTRRYDLVQLIHGLGRRLPPALADEAAAAFDPGDPRFETHADNLSHCLDLLRFRRAMHQEFGR